MDLRQPEQGLHPDGAALRLPAELQRLLEPLSGLFRLAEVERGRAEVGQGDRLADAVRRDGAVEVEGFLEALLGFAVALLLLSPALPMPDLI
jgi:hypothetical protein